VPRLRRGVDRGHYGGAVRPEVLKDGGAVADDGRLVDRDDPSDGARQVRPGDLVDHASATIRCTHRDHDRIVDACRAPHDTRHPKTRLALLAALLGANRSNSSSPQAAHTSVDALKSRPSANAFAFCPLAFHSRTRSAHFDSVPVMIDSLGPPTMARKNGLHAGRTSSAPARSERRQAWLGIPR
jgi:hypothetical protein